VRINLIFHKNVAANLLSLMIIFLNETNKVIDKYNNNFEKIEGRVILGGHFGNPTFHS